ncbi:MAG: RNA-binding domain-containing protein [Patescibacteria group bacterium]
MTEQEIDRLRAGLENEQVEFKEDLKATDQQEAKLHVMRTVSAFYNTKGGVILFGIRDKTAEVAGLADPQRAEQGFAQQLKACIDGADPKREIVDYRGAKLLIVTCPKGPKPPYVVKGPDKPFIRVGSTNIAASDEEIARMYRERSSDPQDRQPVLTATLEDLNMAAAESYLRETSSSGIPTDPIRALTIEGLLVADGIGRLLPTVAGILLFGKNPQTFLPHTVIRADVKLTDEQEEWDDLQTISGTLFEQIKGAEAFIKRHVPVAARIVGFRRVETPAVPLEALREAIVNAIVHRDYQDKSADLHIRIRGKGVTIINPGGVLPPLTIEIVLQGDFEPRTRNATVAEAFIRLKVMERRGTGVERMRSMMRKAQLPEPSFTDQGNSFRVVFSAPIAQPKQLVEEKALIGEDDIGKLGLDEAHLRILELIQERGEVRTTEVMTALSITRPPALEKLSYLTDRGVLERTTDSRTDPKTAYRLHRRLKVVDDSEKLGQAGLGL